MTAVYESPPKVLHINCNYIFTPLHQAMVEHLNAYGIESQVFVPVYDSNRSVIQPNENVCVSKCFRKWDRAIFSYKQRKIYSQIQKEYSIEDFDCIHAYTLFTDGNCAMRLSQNLGVPYVVAVRNTDVNTFLKRRIHLRKKAVEIMQRASAIFFLSEAYQKLVFDQYVPAEVRESLKKKSYVIPNGIDDFWLENAPKGPKENSIRRIQNKELRVIYAGQIDKNKNAVLTQKALAILRDKGWKTTFTVVGRVSDGEEYQTVMSYPLTEYIEQQPKERLIDFYRENDIFVMPSHAETFGLVYAEAISQGLPVIYTKGQGFDGQFLEGEVGYHVDASSAESVAQGILAVAENYENITQSLCEKAQKFSWKTICGEYNEIYRSIIGV